MNFKQNFRFDRGSVFVLYTSLVMVCYILPVLKITIPYIFAALLMLVFLPISMIKMPNNLNFFIVLMVATFLSTAFYFINGIYGLSDTINEAIRYIRFFLPVIWTLYSLRFCSTKQRCHILIIFGIVMTFILIKTILALEIDSWVARILAQDKATDTAEVRAYRMGNVGGFEFSYMMGIVVICLTWAALRSEKVLTKILCVSGAVIGFYYIIQTMYMTLLILTSVGMLLLFLFDIKSTLVKILIVIGSVVASLSLAPFFKYLSELFSGSLLSTKFIQFYEALTGGGTDSLGSRPKLIMDAVQRWLKSPIWGGYDTSVRTHSLVFSTLEATGLIGFFAFLWCIFWAYKSILFELRKKNIETILLSIVFLYVFALAILNPIGYVFEVTIAAFFITPLWSVLIGSEEYIVPSFEESRSKSKVKNDGV